MSAYEAPVMSVTEYLVRRRLLTALQRSLMLPSGGVRVVADPPGALTRTTTRVLAGWGEARANEERN